MFDSSFQLAFIGPGGPEFIVIMLVLLMMFGAKDAPRILRKLNDMINQIRNTADGFKREVMYGDLTGEEQSFVPPENTDEPGHGEYYDYGEDDGGEGEEFRPEEVHEDESVDETSKSDAEDEDGDAQKA